MDKLPESTKMTVTTTERGFPVARGVDLYGYPYSVQDSSLAEQPALWLGSDSKEGGRAHLTPDMAAALIPLLQRFVANGTIAETTANPSTPEVTRALKPETVAAAIKATEYKYFGDYEMSDDQRQAVDVLVEVARGYCTPARGGDELREALEQIERWDLPASDKFWHNANGSLSDRPMSYEAAYGSNGAREYIRSVARKALASTDMAGASVPDRLARRMGAEFVARDAASPKATATASVREDEASVCEHGIRSPWQCYECDEANPPPPGYDPLAGRGHL